MQRRIRFCLSPPSSPPPCVCFVWTAKTDRPTNSRQLRSFCVRLSRGRRRTARKTTPVDSTPRPLSLETTRGNHLFRKNAYDGKLAPEYGSCGGIFICETISISCSLIFICSFDFCLFFFFQGGDSIEIFERRQFLFGCFNLF